MSVRSMATVWEKSQHSGTNLLMLLAIADFADDDGRAYPSVATLARKCRMKERNAQYILSELIESSELAIQRGNGPRGCNVYKINLKALGVQQSAPMQSTAPMQQGAPTPCNRVRITPATQCTQTIIEPSKNHHGQSRVDLNGSFAAFWKAFPKKRAKGDAQKAWQKIKPDSDLVELILNAIGEQRRSKDWEKDNGAYIPYPATWLNGRRWEDESVPLQNTLTSTNQFAGAL